jgi:exosortase E/protease (VPEID-CTERM system)
MLKRWRTNRPADSVETMSASASLVLNPPFALPLIYLGWPPVSLLSRLVLLAILFTLELVPITMWLDGQPLLEKGGVLALLGYSGAWVLKGVVAFAALFATFLVLDRRDVGRQISDQLSLVKPISLIHMAGHAGMLICFAALARLLYDGNLSGAAADVVAGVWFSAGVAAIALAAVGFIPLRFWLQLWRGAGTLGIYALATSAVACTVGAFAGTLWRSSAQWTYLLVKALLQVFLPGVFADLSTMSIGTRSFHVEISEQCSGLEGAVLILSFCTLWLWLLRREFRFPRALILAPVSVAILFLLNAVRIATLILIGNAGAPEIALGGFHSQAGWIAFNAVAIGIVVMSRRVRWIAAGRSETALAPALAPATEDSPAAAYLVPFLLILAAGMVSSAASSGFEWLYPLRLFAAGTALWMYRRRYQSLDWRFGWEAPAVGALVFALWLGGDWLTGNHPQNPLTPSADPRISTAQNIWLALRLLSATVTVPIAEELAFRAYLIRRIMSPDFESINVKTFTAASLLISSLAFGLLHGGRWIAGTVAGLLYAAILVRRGRIGDAVIAHATTNGLLAASVLVTGQWNLS